jgi:4-diphosphocytidyl-2C-methyl-D-erythritol kinase
MAAELGSDVPFFLHGGTAIAAGRGEQIEPLPDAPEQTLVIAWDESAQEENKTAAMYGALRPEHYSDGTWTTRLAERLRRGKAARNEDVYNVFEQASNPEGASSRRWVERLSAQTWPMRTLRLTRWPASRTKRTRPETRRTTMSTSSHLCGSGPAFFFLAASDDQAGTTARTLRGLGLETIVTRTLASTEALTIEELP